MSARGSRWNAHGSITWSLHFAAQILRNGGSKDMQTAAEKLEALALSREKANRDYNERNRGKRKK